MTEHTSDVPIPRDAASPADNQERTPRILIVRLSAIGDVLMSSPVAQALREAYPAAHITWVVEPAAAPFVRANPYVDDLLLVDIERGWARLLREGKLRRLLREFRAFRKELRERRFDIALDCQGLLRSGLVAWLSRAPRRIGPAPPREYNHLFMTERAPSPPHPTRITQASLAMLAPLGIPLTPRRPVLAVPEEERAQARAFLAAYELEPGAYVACCIATSRPQKDWVWSRWSELADKMRQREGLRTVFVGGPERRVDALQLVESSAAEPVSAAGHTSLLQSAAIAQDAALVIGCDTGVTYAGLATDTPTVVLYGSTDGGWLAEEPFAAICFRPMPCSPCRRRPTCKDFDCMQAIQVSDVVEAACALLARKSAA